MPIYLLKWLQNGGCLRKWLAVEFSTAIYSEMKSVKSSQSSLNGDADSKFLTHIEELRLQTRGVPEPKIDGRACATVIQTNTCASKMTLARDIQLDQ